MKKTSVFATLLAGALLAFAPGCRNDGTQPKNAAQPAGATSPGASAETKPSPPASDRQPVSGSDKSGDKMADPSDKADPAAPKPTGATAEGSQAADQATPTSAGAPSGKPDAGAKK